MAEDLTPADLGGTGEPEEAGGAKPVVQALHYSHGWQQKRSRTGHAAAHYKIIERLRMADHGRGDRKMEPALTTFVHYVIGAIELQNCRHLVDMSIHISSLMAAPKREF